MPILVTLSLLAVLLATGALPAQEPPLRPYRPGVDVLHYELSLELPDTGSQIRGRAVLTLQRTGPVDTLVLDLVALQVDSALVEGRPVAFRRAPGTVHIPLPPGRLDTLQVAVRYGGSPQDGLIIRTGPDGRWTGFGDNWPNRGRHWIPSVDHPSDKATVDWNVIAPVGRRVLANGALVEEVPLPGGRVLTRWRESRPVPVYLMVVGAAELAHFDLGRTACGLSELPGCVPQAVYVAPEVRHFLPGPFAEAPGMVAHYSTLVAPFPYEKLAHVQSSTRFGGMENATVIFYSDRAFREGTLDVGLVAHETVHHWFGNSVTPRDWPHLWLSEGFATYFTQLWMEHSRGEAALREGMAELRREILAADVVARRPVIDTAQTDLLKLLNENSYQKGGWVLHMLRDLVGDSAFFAGIRSYYQAHRHGTALSADLQRAVEQASGRELGWFFDQWLRRPGYAELSTRWRFDAAGRRLVLEVEQGPRFAPYRFPLTVDVVDDAGRRRRATVQVDALPRQTLVVPLDLQAAPREVVLDPEVRLLASFTTR